MVEINTEEFQQQVTQMFDHVKEACKEAVEHSANDLHDEIQLNILEGYIRLGWKPISDLYREWRVQHGYSPDPMGHVLDEDLINSLMKSDLDHLENEINMVVYIQRLMFGYETVQEFGGGGTWGYVPPRPYFQPAIDTIKHEFAITIAEDISRAL